MFPEGPVLVHQRHAHGGVGIQHLFGRDDLDLVAVDVETDLLQRDPLEDVVGFLDQIEVPVRPVEQQLPGPGCRGSDSGNQAA